MMRWRLLDTGALPASLNMAIDQALLQLHVRGESSPTLRFYQWEPPAVSLGALQRWPGFDAGVCRRLGLDVVRRPTGGRAVLHQGDLTYGVVAGTREGVPVTLADAYHLLCRGLLAGFYLLGIEAEPGRDKVRADQPDVCFLRSLVGDIAYRGKKFVGSAQTWQGSSLLQHGSILLEPQAETWAELLGGDGEERRRHGEVLKGRMTSLGEILGQVLPISTVKAAIAQGMAQSLGVVFAEGRLTPAEWALAHEMAETLREMEPEARGRPSGSRLGGGKSRLATSSQHQ
jgi:lipoyl(octanoyl) transferase